MVVNVGRARYPGGRLLPTNYYMPIALLERIKTFLWKLFEPLFPTIRDTLVFLGFIKHNERQPYPYGWLKDGASERSLRALLAKAGFSSDYLGWIDPGEVLNMRRIVNTIYQYHVRLFQDGEVRAHYEYTTESHPFKHLHDVGLEDGASYLEPLLAPVLSQNSPHSPNGTIPNPTPRQRRSGAAQLSGNGEDQ